MSDGLTLNPGLGGGKVATKDGGAAGHYQEIKFLWGTHDNLNWIGTGAGQALPTTIYDASGNVCVIQNGGLVVAPQALNYLTDSVAAVLFDSSGHQATIQNGALVVTPQALNYLTDSVTAVGPLTDTQLRASAVPVSGPLTDTQLRATAVPVSGTVTAVTGGLTDAQLRASAVPTTGPLTDTQLRASAVPTTGPLTDTQLRASAVPTTGPLTDTQLRATAVPTSVTNFPAAIVPTVYASAALEKRKTVGGSHSLIDYYAYNKSGTDYWLHFFDSVSAAGAGSVPIRPLPLLAHSGAGWNFEPDGYPCVLGIDIAVSSTEDTLTLIASNDVLIGIRYQ
jgi:hypothetical protein